MIIKYFSTGFKLSLRKIPSINIVGTASDGEEVLQILERQENVDIAILDIEMSRLNGVETSKIIRKKFPNTKVLILSMYNDKNLIQELMKIGVSGYVLKNKTKEQLIHAIYQVNAGNAHFGLEVLNSLVTHSKDGSSDDEIELTEREIQVLKLIGEGMTSKEISQALHIRETTVNTHKRILLHKIKVPNDKHLVRYAIKYGYSTL